MNQPDETADSSAGLPALPSAQEGTQAATPARAIVCANCNTVYEGKFCPACGQPAKTPLRHLPALAEDALDLAFNIDGRIVHTLPPLLLRPGFLSNEYFAGRRVRYIPPFRLMFVLSVLAFLLLRFAIGIGVGDGMKVQFKGSFESAKTPAQVHEQLQAAVDGMTAARLATGGAGAKHLDELEAKLRKDAAQRLDELAAAAGPASAGSAGASSTAPPPASSTGKAPAPASPSAVPAPAASADVEPTPTIEVFGADSSRIRRVTQQIKKRLRAAAHDPQERQRMIASIFRVLPQTMLVLLPLFALLLKFAYIFKRRLYIEHLIVAMHSHAFMFLVLLLLTGIWLASRTWPAFSGPLGFLTAALWIWLPVYLLLMQKRVYRQGWFFTLLKYAVLGLCYFILLGFALVSAFVIGAATA
jgi:hypothetical protein